MQLVPFDQSTDCYYPSCVEKIGLFFLSQKMLPQRRGWTEGLDFVSVDGSTEALRVGPATTMAKRLKGETRHDCVMQTL